MLEDQIFFKLLVRFLNLVINSDSDVHWLQREEIGSIHAWRIAIESAWLLGVFSLDGTRPGSSWIYKRNKDVTQLILKIDQQIHQHVTKWWTQKKDAEACKNYSHCCQNCKINQQVLQQSQQTGPQNCAEICQGSTCCAPSLRSPWWDAKAATWVD